MLCSLIMRVKFRKVSEKDIQLVSLMLESGLTLSGRVLLCANASKRTLIYKHSTDFEKLYIIIIIILILLP